ncbi:MAG: hypothetical protein H6Q35_2500 [Proteobacteria bacterium]|nr:hypothetical protein [Pseudomonadota bacterium]MBS1229277.1 hypothetical protein [Pseudomonadota bacterium]
MHAELDLDDFWEDFLSSVEERRVIPIIGPELLQVRVGGEPLPLYRVVAERLADKLRVDMGEAPPQWGLDDVVCRYLQGRGRREELYPRIRAIMKELLTEVELPDALLKLARISAFDVYLSLTCDNLLASAIDRERFAGAERTQQIAYAPNKIADLPVTRDELKTPVVYSLLGKLSVAPDYVITEEDLLEFLCALQSDAKRPHLLFDALQASHLLFLGCSFPDWLARFFIRIAKSRQLSQQRGESELIVNPRVASEPQLVLFLENFSYGTRILSMEPLAFIDELARRWQARHPPVAAVSAAPSAEPDDGEALPDLPAGGIFISYAKEDVDAVIRLHDALEELGLDVWFDRQRLEAGDSYDRKIRNNIKACSLFVAVVSRNTERRLEGYFRREWKLAEERAWSIADGVPFILPVVIDDTPPYESKVPESFLKTQWTQLADGVPPAEFETRLVKLVRDYRKRERGLA